MAVNPLLIAAAGGAALVALTAASGRSGRSRDSAGGDVGGDAGGSGGRDVPPDLVSEVAAGVDDAGQPIPDPQRQASPPIVYDEGGQPKLVGDDFIGPRGEGEYAVDAADTVAKPETWATAVTLVEAGASGMAETGRTYVSPDGRWFFLSPPTSQILDAGLLHQDLAVQQGIAPCGWATREETAQACQSGRENERAQVYMDEGAMVSIQGQSVCRLRSHIIERGLIARGPCTWDAALRAAQSG